VPLYQGVIALFNIPEISETFSEVIFDERIRETDQLPIAYGKTFEEFYGLPPREETVEEAPAHTPSEQPATECSDGCRRTFDGSCVFHQPLVETAIAVEVKCTDQCHDKGWTMYHDHPPQAQAEEEEEEEEEEIPDVCGPDCPGRWGTNCLHHWVDPDGPRRITDPSELEDFLFRQRWDTWDVISQGRIPGENYDLMATNSVAIRVRDRFAAEGAPKNYQYVLVTEETLHFVRTAGCEKHGQFRRLFASCYCRW
jgi:hypothetical protein